MVDWTDDRIAALADKDLKTLLGNAERKAAAELVAKCNAELEKRDAAKPRKGGRRALRIDAGTPLESTPREDLSDLPPHLRNDPPKDRRKEDPWADEGT